ncbi:hypothetical protein HYALB_00003337 [Hymenoscyphus albidus]|uniref:U1-type domain-containing protein n=1 Tax=Hymenoscyphus albidus TaxID=595503 RepID=A0A9N9Q7T7_9HELO|nr:hypothetical protein HYALB_00003337 [Hymenoscyphus albidus]
MAPRSETGKLGKPLVRDLVEKRASCKASKAKAKREKRFFCETCQLPFESSTLLNAHNQTIRNNEKINGIAHRFAKNPDYAVWAEANLQAKKYFCQYCDYNASTSSKLQMHFTSKRHEKAVTDSGKKTLAQSTLDSMIPVSKANPVSKPLNLVAKPEIKTATASLPTKTGQSNPVKSNKRTSQLPDPRTKKQQKLDLSSSSRDKLELSR